MEIYAKWSKMDFFHFQAIGLKAEAILLTAQV
jgi:hypothetical protein